MEEVVLAAVALVFVVPYGIVWLTAVADVASSPLPAAERRSWFALLVVLHVVGPYLWFRFSRRQAPYGWPAAMPQPGARPPRGPARG